MKVSPNQFIRLEKSFSCTSGVILSYFNVKTNKASGITAKLIIKS